MGKWCLESGLFILDRIFIKHAGDQDRHKISDKFEFRLDWIGHLGVTCPWGRFKFSIDLLWNQPFRWKYTWYLVGATPLTVFHQLFWKFSDVFCMEWRCACALDIILWLFFSHFFCFVNLSLFSVWTAIKVYRQWVPCGRNSSYSFPPIVLKHCRCFQHGMKICMWFWYNTLIIFLTFSALWTLPLSLHEMLSKCVDSGYLVGATPLQFSFNCFETLQMFSAWNEDVHVVWV